MSIPHRKQSHVIPVLFGYRNKTKDLQTPHEQASKVVHTVVLRLIFPFLKHANFPVECI